MFGLFFYQHLSRLKELSFLRSDWARILQNDAFKDQLRKYGSYAVIVGAIVFPLFHSESYLVPNLEEANASDNVEEIVEEKMLQISDSSKRTYNQSVVDLFEDLAHFGYI